MGKLGLLVYAALLALGLGVLAYALQGGQPHSVADWGSAVDFGWLPVAPPGSAAAARVWLFTAFAILALVHLAGVRAARGVLASRGVLALVLTGSAALSLLAAVNQDALSNDISSYIIYGRMIVEHGLNPMTTAPVAVAGDPFFGQVTARFQDAVSVYGPYWNVTSAAATYAAEWLGGSVQAYLWVYRLIMLASMLGASWAIWSTLGQLAPRFTVAGTLLFAWNPLVLVETAALHNDIVMVALTAVGVLLLVRGRPYWALSALLVAVLVKWIAVVPLLVLMAGWLSSLPAGRRLKALARAAGVSLLVVVPPLIAFKDPIGSLLSPFSEAGSGIRSSLSEFLVIAVSRMTGTDVASVSPTVELLSRAAVAVAVVVAIWLAWRRPTIGWAVTVSTAALLIVLLVAPRFWPWYALWPLVLAPFSLLPLRWAALALSYTAPLNYVLYPSEENPSLFGPARSLFVFGPPVVVFGLGIWRSYRDRRAGDGALAQSRQETAQPST